MKQKILGERFKMLEEKLKDKDFLSQRGTGNEVPFYIFAYDHHMENTVKEEIDGINKRLTKAGIKILELNLYVMSIEILKREDLLDLFIEKENTFSKDKLLQNLKGALDIETEVAPLIEEKAKENKPHIVFITGVGLVYPYLRTHGLLNNLQSRVTDIPLIVFYPGVYTGQSLSLFGKLKAENYYRAFNLF